MRLIDADALLERIMDINSWYLYNEWGSETEFHKLIDEAPTIEPTDTNLISRADAIKAIRKCKFESDMPSYWYRGMEDAQDIIENIPSAELPKGDLISRKVLMDRLESFCKWCKDGRLQGAEFVWDCIVPNVPSADVIHSGGVFVPNMEMPEACDYCLFHDSEWSWCKAKDKYCGDGKCPLIAVRGERREP